MDADDESSAYLEYLNDPTATNNYLLSSNVELSDTFPLSEIEATDWPNETFPVLLSTSLVADYSNGDGVQENVNIQLFNEEATVIQDTAEGEIVVGNINGLANSADTNGSSNDDETLANGHGDNLRTYIPVIRENSNGSREIYFTEKETDASSNVIQLLNTDGSMLTIDRSIISSLKLPKQCSDKNVTVENKNYEAYYTSVIAHKCKVCSTFCETDDEIRKHLNEKHPDLFKKNIFTCKNKDTQTSLLKSSNESNKKYIIFLCSLCRLAFSDKDHLRGHMISDHQLTTSDGNTEVCEQVAPKSSSNEKCSLRALSNFLVKQQEKARKKVKCTIKGCHVRFADDKTRERHEQYHVGNNRSQFKCLVCDKVFSMWRVCSSHLWNVHEIDIGLLNCPMCNKVKSNSSLRLLNHMAVHDEEKPFLCSDCGKAFKTISQVKNHEVLHRKTDEDLPKWFTTKKCTTCEGYFANSKSLKKHIQAVHENFKPFICNICGHKTSRKAMLELHLRQHTGEKPYKCSYCEYRARDHNCLRKHVMKHLGLQKYKCPFCNYTAIQSASYKNHIKNRHPGENGIYNCTHCSFSSINFSNYSVHMKGHKVTVDENNSQQLRSKENGEVSEGQSRTAEVEDDETQNCIFSSEAVMEETVDTGGITIPAEADHT